MKKERKKKKLCQFHVNSIVSTITDDLFYCWGEGWNQRVKVQENWFIPKMPRLFPFPWRSAMKYLPKLSSSTTGMEKEQWSGFVLKVGPVGQRNFKNIMIIPGKVQSKDTRQNGQRQNLGSWLLCHTLNNTSTALIVKGFNFFLSSQIVILGWDFRLWKRFWRTVGKQAA